MAVLATDSGVIVLVTMALLVGGWGGWKIRGLREKFRRKA